MTSDCGRCVCPLVVRAFPATHLLGKCLQDWSKTIPADKQANYEAFEVQVDEDLDKVMEKKGVKAEDVEVIIISREFCGHRHDSWMASDSRDSAAGRIDNHFDHCGTLRGFERFPSARVIVGPDSRSKIPALHDHKNVTELSWHHSPTRIAAFEHSYDVWNDGSLVVVATPGHTTGHIAALVRTTAPSATPASEGEYLLLAGDCCHSGLLLHPTPAQSHLRIGRWRNPGEPLTEPPAHSMHEDLLQAEFSFERVKAAERKDEVMVVLAHDKRRWDLWGGSANALEGFELAEWRKKGLKV